MKQQIYQTIHNSMPRKWKFSPYPGKSAFLRCSAPHLGNSVQFHAVTLKSKFRAKFRDCRILDGLVYN